MRKLFCTLSLTLAISAFGVVGHQSKPTTALNGPVQIADLPQPKPCPITQPDCHEMPFPPVTAFSGPGPLPDCTDNPYPDLPCTNWPKPQADVLRSVTAFSGPGPLPDCTDNPYPDLPCINWPKPQAYVLRSLVS